MIIEKRENDLYLELEQDDSKEFINIIQNDDLFQNDLSFYHSSVDGWQYLYDANKNKVCSLTYYSLDTIDDLIKKGKTTIPYENNDDIYKDFEWNET